MNDPQAPIVQLVTQIPEALRRRLKVHCIERGTTVSAFVIAAIVDRLGREARRAAR